MLEEIAVKTPYQCRNNIITI